MTSPYKYLIFFISSGGSSLVNKFLASPWNFNVALGQNLSIVPLKINKLWISFQIKSAQMEHHLVFLEEKWINSSFYFSSYILFRIYVDRQSKQLINYYSFQTGDRSLLGVFTIYTVSFQNKVIHIKHNINQKRLCFKIKP